MDICDLGTIAYACMAADAAATAVTDVAAEGILNTLSDNFANAVETVLDAVFEAISSTTTVDLSAAYVERNTAALASVALILIVGLFVIQVLTAALRGEPGGLGRALLGAGTAVLGTAAAAAITQSLLVAVDEICDAIAALAGTSIEDAARKLLDISMLLDLTGNTGARAVLVIVFGALFIIGAILTLGTLLVREALIVVAVVVAPLAIAGTTARLTTGWVRRWIQVTLALILSKLAIVVVFVVAVGMVGEGGGLGALLSGLILLLLACLAPWACFKFLDFAGTSVASEWHRATNGSTLAAVHQGRTTAQSLMRTAAPIVGGHGGVAASRAASSGGAARGASTTMAASVRSAGTNSASTPAQPTGQGTASSLERATGAATPPAPATAPSARSSSSSSPAPASTPGPVPTAAGRGPSAPGERS